jgi:hypothetical protein
MSTASDGRFQFSGLPAGAYYLYANRPDLLSARYGERIYGRGGRTIPLTDGERRDVRLTLFHRSKISGRVLDTAGRPLVRASVRLVKLMPAALYGYPATFPWGSVTTDQTGSYQFASVDPADYAVCASTPERLPVDPHVGYGVGCFPSSADSPEKITVGPEEAKSGVNIRLAAVRLHRVAGALDIPDGALTPDLVFLTNVDEMYEDPSLAVPPIGGRFVFENVPAGHYVVRAQSGSARDGAGGLTELVVGDTDLPDVVLSLSRGSRVEGHLAFHGTVVASDGAKQPRLLLGSPVPGPRHLRWGAYQATPDATGGFVFPSVQPGTYRLSANYPQPQSWYMESVAANRPDQLVEVHGGQDVTGVILNMTDYRAEVTGTIVDERGLPAPEFMIVVYPANQKDWNAPTAFGRSQYDGTFVFRLKSPGTYRVGFIPDYDPAVRIGPDTLRNIDRASVTVTVVEDGKNAVRLVVPRDR